MGASSWLVDFEFVICCLEDLMIRVFMNICFMNRVVLNGNTLSTNICLFIRKEKLYLSSYFNLLNCCLILLERKKWLSIIWDSDSVIKHNARFISHLSFH